MDGLSNQIMQEIVSHLCSSDIDSVRLVSRKFSAIANIFKFRALRVRISRKGFDSILNISRHPELAQCVREITYPFGHLSPIEELHSTNEDRVDTGIRRLAHSVSMFFEWYNYREKFAVQIELEESGECVHTLQTVLLRMPNVRAIKLGNCDLRCILRNEFKNWRKMLTHTESAFFDQWDHDYWWNVLLLLQEEEGEERALKTVMDLINTTHRLGVKLDIFEFNISWGWLGLGIFHNNSVLWDCVSLFMSLTCLSVCIPTQGMYQNPKGLKETAKEGQLHRFLSFTPNLRKLSLAVQISLNISGPLYLFTGPEIKSLSISLLDILGHGHVWKYLHTFHLELPCIILEELVEFLRRHARTLKSLHLQIKPLILDSMSWRELLDFLKERLHIMDFEIVSPGEILFDGHRNPRFMRYKVNAQLRMKNYVLHGGTPFPPTKQELKENGWDIFEYYLKDTGDYSEEEEDV
ncbi:hypothetical protein RUND412_004488 [Rhizina undulata]